MKLVVVFSLLLIILNLISLYFIIDLLSYDEIIGYLSNGKEKSCDPRVLAFLFLATGACNLLFISITILSRWLSEKQ